MKKLWGSKAAWRYNEHALRGEEREAQGIEADKKAELARDEDDLNRRLDGEEREREERDDPMLVTDGGSI